MMGIMLEGSPLSWPRSTRRCPELAVESVVQNSQLLCEAFSMAWRASHHQPPHRLDIQDPIRIVRQPLACMAMSCLTGNTRRSLESHVNHGVGMLPKTLGELAQPLHISLHCRLAHHLLHDFSHLLRKATQRQVLHAGIRHPGGPALGLRNPTTQRRNSSLTCC